MEPVIVEFEVAASTSHAFEVWTARSSIWWPRSHTASKDPDVTIVFEPFVGERVYERASDGVEHDWGETLEWDPPGRLRYLWHLAFPQPEATEVVVTFEDASELTSVRIEQTGFERLGESTSTERRTRNQQGWRAIAEVYADAL
jgi:hypothetical protein